MIQPDDPACDGIAARLGEIAWEAGRLLRRMQAGAGDHRVKPDGSPTSPADLAAEQLILARLQADWPGVPVVAEETSNAAEAGDAFFLVDPLDGTPDYLDGLAEYSVNIALVVGRRPVAAAVLAPRLGRLWVAGTHALAGDLGPDLEGSGPTAWREIRARAAPPGGLVALVSRRHVDPATEACLATLSIGTRLTASSALKFCLIAGGEADIYVRCGPTMEWDTAAGDHILTRAGGCVIRSGGGFLTYGERGQDYRNGPFAALGDPSLAARMSLPVPEARPAVR